MKVDLLTMADGWLRPALEELAQDIQSLGHACTCFFHHNDLESGDILFILSYLRIIPPQSLSLHSRNLLIHESDLPEGRGWSPMSWQISQDRREIVFSMIEAVQEVDAGDIFMQRVLQLSGTELHQEWRSLQASMTRQMVMEYIRNPVQQGVPQRDSASIYRKRTADDDRIDPSKPLEESFDIIRVCNPDSYPAWFTMRGSKFRIRIERIDAP